MAYSWGDDTNTWANPGKYNYGSAKRAYVDPSKPSGPRSYERRAMGPEMKLVNPLRKEISSGSMHPIVVGIDCTGSMADWPGEIFDRLPLFCQTLAKYQPDVELSFSVIGDAYCDEYPLQVADFGKGPALDKVLNAFYPEGGGGGQQSESYELWAYYMLKHSSTPKATSPFLIIMGDESFYELIEPSQAKHYIGDNLEKPLDSFEVWRALGQRYNVFLLHKEYGYGASDDDILKFWETALGRQKIVRVPSKERVVDVAMGIIARAWGKFGDFMTNISARQDDATVSKVVDAINKTPGIDDSTNSRTKKSRGAGSKPLA